jgi:TolB protein
MIGRRVAALLSAVAIAAAGCGGSETRTTSKPAHAAPHLGVNAPGVIVFRRYTDAAHTQSEIWRMRPDGSAARRLTPGGLGDQPALSPDGRRIAYEECPDGEPCHTFVMDVDGAHRRELHVRCTLRPICDIGQPAWSADGRLAVNRSSGRVRHVAAGDTIERSEIVIVDPAGGEGRSVARSRRFGADLLRPVWSPDGERIAFEFSPSVALGPPRAALRVVSADGGRPRQITGYSLGAGDAPDWSPDGKWISFRTHAESDGAPSDLELVHPDGSGRRNLTHYGSSGNVALSSSFSPDGSWIVFAAQDDRGAADLLVMRSDGTDLHRLTRTAAWDSAPEWGVEPR